MIVGAHQPHYLPWIRWFDKLARCDVFILLDDVQFTKNGYQNRVKIKHAQGSMLLTVPVLDPVGKAIRDVDINAGTRWRAKHRTALANNYAKAPYYARYRDLIDSIYDRPWTSLFDCIEYALGLLLPALGIRTRLVRSSDLGIPGKGTERLIELCRAVDATVYLTGDFAVGHHFDPAAFAPYGIEVRRQAWQCPTYRQQYPQCGFLPELSILDLLFNEGDRSLAVLMERPSARPDEPAAPGPVPSGASLPLDPAFGRGRSDETDDSSLCRAAASEGGFYTDCEAAHCSETP